MPTKEVIENNKKLLQNFLIYRPIPKQYRTAYPEKLPFGFIYCIENKDNHKKYIGSTYSIWTDIKNIDPMAALRKRASNYLYEYNSNIRNKDKPDAKKFDRPIIQAMVDFGFEKFIMYPIAETRIDNHQGMEKYFIQLFNTIADGYNVTLEGQGIRGSGTKQSANDKLIRSDQIICINPSEKKILLSDSMKLFGDYLNSSKDMIKNTNRKGRSYKGWFVFYVDETKRAYILEKNVKGDGLPLNDRHSEKSKTNYEILYGKIDMYIRDWDKVKQFPGLEKLPSLVYKD